MILWKTGMLVTVWQIGMLHFLQLNKLKKIVSSLRSILDNNEIEYIFPCYIDHISSLCALECLGSNILFQI